MKVIIDGKEYVEKTDINYSTGNSGNFNSGDYNSGDCNSCDYNSGNFNSGNMNSGDYNSGDRNSGTGNSGTGNSGNFNSGNFNSGDYNSGNWNSCDYNSGILNTTKPTLRIFNKQNDLFFSDINIPDFFYFDLNIWVNLEHISEEEKENCSWYKTTGGYLKKLDYKESWKHSFDEASIDDVKLTLDLPNFDYDLFEEISGISKKDFEEKLK